MGKFTDILSTYVLVTPYRYRYDSTTTLHGHQQTRAIYLTFSIKHKWNLYKVFFVDNIITTHSDTFMMAPKHSALSAEIPTIL